MKIKGLIICILICILTLFAILHFTSCSMNNVKNITKYVNENHEELEKIAKKFIEGNNINYPEIINSISVYSKDDIHVKNDNTIVQFIVDGYGMVPSSKYIGFYYSEKDIPASFQNEAYELKKIEKNKWVWFGLGDNHGTTIKIRSNWYYFEASF